jgi:hypothetical protein
MIAVKRDSFFDKCMLAVTIAIMQICVTSQEPILRLLNLQLQRQRCSRLQRFSKWNKMFWFSKRTRLPVALIPAIVGLALGVGSSLNSESSCPNSNCSSFYGIYTFCKNCELTLTEHEQYLRRYFLIFKWLTEWCDVHDPYTNFRCMCFWIDVFFISSSIAFRTVQCLCCIFLPWILLLI